jgi:arabinogalactan oligomer/maltooligosaccharide transport system substrate-binding protein
MKKRNKLLALALGLCMCFSIGSLSACGGNKDTVVIWAAEEEKALMETLVSEFKAANPDVKENIEVVVQSVWNAQSVVAKDPEAAADVIMIPHDQVGIMAKQGLLAEIRDGTSATFATDVKTLNAPATVQQATYDGKVYGFPLTMDTYILYYDTTIFPDKTESQRALLKSVDAMLALEMANIPGTKEKATAFGFRIEDGFYLNMGFFAMGCTLYGAHGDDVTACDWNNAQGLKFMQYAAKNFRQSGKKFKSDDVKNLAVNVLNHRQGACISGGWEMQDTFKNAEHIGYTTLPSITIDGEEKELVSFSNSKLYVVNNRSEYKGTASRLAAFVTSEANQLRYASERGYYPTNLQAQQSDAVTGNAFFQVIRAQLDKSVPVPVIPEISRYWEPAKSLGSSLYNGSLKGDDASLQAALDTFVASLQKD